MEGGHYSGLTPVTCTASCSQLHLKNKCLPTTPKTENLFFIKRSSLCTNPIKPEKLISDLGKFAIKLQHEICIQSTIKEFAHGLLWDLNTYLFHDQCQTGLDASFDKLKYYNFFIAMHHFWGGRSQKGM